MTEILEVFEKAATSYDEWYSRPMGVYAFRSELFGLETMLPSSGVGIDAGAGTGIFTKHLSTEERTIICLEPSQAMLREARKRNVKAILSTAEASPIRRVLDFAYMVTVLEFLPDPLKALSSLGKTLREDALLVVLLINRDSLWGEYYSKLAEKGNPIFSCARFYTYHEVSTILKKAGYKLEESIGTLTASPEDPKKKIKLVPILNKVGVILIKAKLKTNFAPD